MEKDGLLGMFSGLIAVFVCVGLAGFFGESGSNVICFILILLSF